MSGIMPPRQQVVEASLLHKNVSFFDLLTNEASSWFR